MQVVQEYELFSPNRSWEIMQQIITHDSKLFGTSYKVPYSQQAKN